MGKETINKNFDTELTVSCMNQNTILKYLKRHYADISPLFSGFEVTEEYLSDPNNWISMGTGKRLFYRIKDFTGNRDPRLFFEIGRETESLESLGALEQVARLYPNPRIVVERIPHYNRKFNNLYEMEVYDIEPRSAKMNVKYRSDFREDFIYDECPWIFGIIATIPRIWGLPDMQIIEKQCIFNLEEIVDESYGYLGLKTRFEKGRFYVDDEEYAHEVFTEDGKESLGYVATKDLDVGDTHILTKGVIYGAPYCTAELRWESKSIIRNLYDLTLGRAKQWLASREALEKQLDYSKQQFFEIQRLNQQLREYATSLERKVEQRTAELMEETEARMKAEELAGVAQLSFGLGHDLRNILSKAIQSGIPVSRIIDDVRTLRELYRQGKITEAENHIKERNLDTRLNMVSESFKTMNDSLAEAIQNIRALEGYTTEDGSDFISLRVEDVLGKVLEDYEDRLREVKLETQFVEQSYSIKGNPLKLYRVFLNILINSLEALEGREEPEIVVKTRLENGKHITVIEDNGIGVSEEVRKNIFKPYTTTKGLSEGRQRGLGLSITHDLVKQHGGNIEMESRPGEYTRVIVSFDATG